ncbi:MAG: RNA pyrophosphohydrolase [Rhodospirillales bacterium]|nr:RNA pyrophosphohydrolase [Rhodospirillales bacterium]
MNLTKPKPLPYRRGVGAVLFNAAGLVFVARRIDTPGANWQLPQGGVDPREKPREAVLRELKEEIGTDKAQVIAKSRHWYCYDLPDDLIGKVWGGKFRGQKQRWFALRFNGVDADIDLAADDHPEFDAWRWTSIETLPGLAVPFKRSLYSSLLVEFAHLAVPVPSRHPGESVTSIK